MALPEIAGLMFFGFIVLILAVPIGLVVLIRRRGRERSQPLAAQAAALGFEFSAGRVLDIPAALMAHPQLAGGIDPKAYDALRGEFDGNHLIVLDHASVRSFGDNATTDRRHGFSRRTVVAIHPRMPLEAPAAEQLAVSSGWIVFIDSGDGSANDRMRRLQSATMAIRETAGELGAALQRALTHRAAKSDGSTN